MSNLNNLVNIGQLKKEPFDQKEFDGLVSSGRARLKDAKMETLAPESRFDLAYNAAHALSLAALRFQGFRPVNQRYIIFKVLPLTLKIDSPTSRILSKCHDKRNLAEYEGHAEVDEILLSELLKAVEQPSNQIKLLNNTKK